MAQGPNVNPVTAFFKNLANPGGANQQQNNQQVNRQNGPTNQQQNRQGPNNQQQNIDPAQFKFDPITGKPIGGGSSNNPETHPDPLKAYEGLWAKADSGEEDQVPRFSIKPETLNSAAEGLDFVGNLPEGLSLDGFGDNKDAMLQLLNHVGRMAYATSINHASQLTDKFFDVRSAHEAKKLPAHIRESMTNNAIDNDPAASKSPIIRESLRMVSNQLRAKNPDATPEWIAQTAKRFWLDLTKEMHPDQFQVAEEKQRQQATAPGGMEFDWDGYTKADDRRNAA